MDKKSIVSIIDQYFQRFPFRKIEINDPISLDLKIIVVIPVYNEYAIEDTLESIFLSQKDFSFSVLLLCYYCKRREEKGFVVSHLRNSHQGSEACDFDIASIFLVLTLFDFVSHPHSGCEQQKKISEK